MCRSGAMIRPSGPSPNYTIATTTPLLPYLHYNSKFLSLRVRVRDRSSPSTETPIASRIRPPRSGWRSVVMMVLDRRSAANGHVAISARLMADSAESNYFQDGLTFSFGSFAKTGESRTCGTFAILPSRTAKTNYFQGDTGRSPCVKHVIRATRSLWPCPGTGPEFQFRANLTPFWDS